MSKSQSAIDREIKRSMDSAKMDTDARAADAGAGAGSVGGGAGAGGSGSASASGSRNGPSPTKDPSKSGKSKEIDDIGELIAADIEKGYVKTVKEAFEIRGFDVNWFNPRSYNYSLLITACRARRSDIIIYFLSKDEKTPNKKLANPSHVSTSGRTDGFTALMHLLATTNDSNEDDDVRFMEALGLLLAYTKPEKKGEVGYFDINVPASDGTTYLMMAAMKRSTAVVESILKAGADIDKTDPNGDTALMCAASAGRFDVTKLLRRNGANIHAVNTQGKNILSQVRASYSLSNKKKAGFILQYMKLGVILNKEDYGVIKTWKNIISLPEISRLYKTQPRSVKKEKAAAAAATGSGAGDGGGGGGGASAGAGAGETASPETDAGDDEDSTLSTGTEDMDTTDSATKASSAKGKSKRKNGHTETENEMREETDVMKKAGRPETPPDEETEGTLKKLHSAAEKDLRQFKSYLVKYHNHPEFDINAQNKADNDRTPLMSALCSTSEGSIANVEFLIQRKYGHDKHGDRNIKNKDILDPMLDQIYVNLTDRDGNSELHLVVIHACKESNPTYRERYIKKLGILLENKRINIESVNTKGQTALQIAAKANANEIVAILEAAKDKQAKASAEKTGKRHKHKIGGDTMHRASSKSGSDDRSRPNSSPANGAGAGAGAGSAAADGLNSGSSAGKNGTPKAKTSAAASLAPAPASSPTSPRRSPSPSPKAISHVSPRPTAAALAKPAAAVAAAQPPASAAVAHAPSAAARAVAEAAVAAVAAAKAQTSAQAPAPAPAMPSPMPASSPTPTPPATGGAGAGASGAGAGAGGPEPTIAKIVTPPEAFAMAAAAMSPLFPVALPKSSAQSPAPTAAPNAAAAAVAAVDAAMAVNKARISVAEKATEAAFASLTDATIAAAEAAVSAAVQAQADAEKAHADAAKALESKKPTAAAAGAGGGGGGGAGAGTSGATAMDIDSKVADELTKASSFDEFMAKFNAGAAGSDDSFEALEKLARQREAEALALKRQVEQEQAAEAKRLFDSIQASQARRREYEQMLARMHSRKRKTPEFSDAAPVLGPTMPSAAVAAAASAGASAAAAASVASAAAKEAAAAGAGDGAGAAGSIPQNPLLVTAFQRAMQSGSGTAAIRTGAIAALISSRDQVQNAAAILSLAPGAQGQQSQPAPASGQSLAGDSASAASAPAASPSAQRRDEQGDPKRHKA